MKKLIFILAIMLAALSVEAKQITSKTFLTDIDCPSCTNKIMNILPYQKGIKDVRVDIQKQTVEVKFDAEKTTTKTIEQSLNKVGVKVLSK